MSEPLNTYSIRIMDYDTLRYVQHITAPDEDIALKLFVEEFLLVNLVQEEK